MKIKKVLIAISMSYAFCLSAHAIDSIKVTPLDGQQSSTQYGYENKEDQFPMKVVIHFDNKPTEEQNKQLFDNLEFTLPNAGISYPVSSSDLDQRCTDDPFVRMHVNTGANDDGQEILTTNDRKSVEFWANKTVNKGKWVGSSSDAKFCFTTAKNVFSSGIYGREQVAGAKRINNLSAMSVNQAALQQTPAVTCIGDELNCTAQKIIYMQIDGNNSIGTDSIHVKTHNDAESLDSGNANENINMTKFDRSDTPLTITSSSLAIPGATAYKLTASVSGRIATILYTGSDVDAGPGGATIGPNGDYLPWYSSVYTDHGKYKRNTALISIDNHINIHNAALDSVNDTIYKMGGVSWVYGRFYLDTGANINHDECDSHSRVTVVSMDYNLTSSSGDQGKPQGNQAAYLCTSKEHYANDFPNFRLYILDKFGNFFNTSKIITSTS